MVLHNNKWDRRAKTRYLKKHGISASDVKKQSDEHRPAADNDNIKGSEQPDKLSQDHTENHLNSGGEPVTSEVIGDDESAQEYDTMPEYEEDPEQTRMIRNHFAQGNHDKEIKPHIQTVDKSVFEQAQAGVERSKLNQRVRRIGQNRNTNIDLDSDSDFDDFMDEIDNEDDAADHSRRPANGTSAHTAGVGTSKQSDIEAAMQSHQSFLDSLLK